MFEGLLPIGTVVLLKNSQKRIMIIGLMQKQLKDGEPVIWDYAACFYPEGYMGPDRTFLFNADQIEKIYAVGYQDEEQFEFKVKVDEFRRQLIAQAAEGAPEQTEG